MFPQLRFKKIILGRGERNHNDVVDMDGKHRDTSGCLAVVNTPIAGKAREAERSNHFVESFIPDARRLFHSIDALQ